MLTPYAAPSVRPSAGPSHTSSNIPPPIPSAPVQPYLQPGTLAPSIQPSASSFGLDVSSRVTNRMYWINGKNFSWPLPCVPQIPTDTPKVKTKDNPVEHKIAAIRDKLFQEIATPNFSHQSLLCVIGEFESVMNMDSNSNGISNEYGTVNKTLEGGMPEAIADYVLPMTVTMDDLSLFRSVSALLFGTEEGADLLRCAVLNHLDKNYTEAVTWAQTNPRQSLQFEQHFSVGNSVPVAMAIAKFCRVNIVSIRVSSQNEPVVENVAYHYGSSEGQNVFIGSVLVKNKEVCFPLRLKKNVCTAVFLKELSKTTTMPQVAQGSSNSVPASQNTASGSAVALPIILAKQQDTYYVKYKDIDVYYFQTFLQNIFAKCSNQCTLRRHHLCDAKLTAYSSCTGLMKKLQTIDANYTVSDVLEPTAFRQAENILPASLSMVFSAFCVPEQGNCMFEAAAFAVTLDIALGKALRRMCYYEFVENKSVQAKLKRFSNSEKQELESILMIDETSPYVKTRERWGNEACLAVLSEVLGRNIVMYQPKSNNVIEFIGFLYPTSKEAPQDPIFLYLQDYHYYPLIKKNMDVIVPKVENVVGQLRECVLKKQDLYKQLKASGFGNKQSHVDTETLYIDLESDQEVSSKTVLENSSSINQSSEEVVVCDGDLINSDTLSNSTSVDNVQRSAKNQSLNNLIPVGLSSSNMNVGYTSRNNELGKPFLSLEDTNQGESGSFEEDALRSDIDSLSGKEMRHEQTMPVTLSNSTTLPTFPTSQDLPDLETVENKSVQVVMDVSVNHAQNTQVTLKHNTRIPVKLLRFSKGKSKEKSTSRRKGKISQDTEKYYQEALNMILPNGLSEDKLKQKLEDCVNKHEPWKDAVQKYISTFAKKSKVDMDALGKKLRRRQENASYHFRFLSVLKSQGVSKDLQDFYTNKALKKFPDLQKSLDIYNYLQSDLDGEETNNQFSNGGHGKEYSVASSQNASLQQAETRNHMEWQPTSSTNSHSGTSVPNRLNNDQEINDSADAGAGTHVDCINKFGHTTNHTEHNNSDYISTCAAFDVNVYQATPMTSLLPKELTQTWHDEVADFDLINKSLLAKPRTRLEDFEFCNERNSTFNENRCSKDEDSRGDDITTTQIQLSTANSDALTMLSPASSVTDHCAVDLSNNTEADFINNIQVVSSRATVFDFPNVNDNIAASQDQVFCEDYIETTQINSPSMCTDDVASLFPEASAIRTSNGKTEETSGTNNGSHESRDGIVNDSTEENHVHFSLPTSDDLLSHSTAPFATHVCKVDADERNLHDTSFENTQTVNSVDNLGNDMEQSPIFGLSSLGSELHFELNDSLGYQASEADQLLIIVSPESLIDEYAQETNSVLNGGSEHEHASFINQESEEFSTEAQESLPMNSFPQACQVSPRTNSTYFVHAETSDSLINNISSRNPTLVLVTPPTTTELLDKISPINNSSTEDKTFTCVQGPSSSNKKLEQNATEGKIDSLEGEEEWPIPLARKFRNNLQTYCVNAEKQVGKNKTTTSDKKAGTSGIEPAVTEKINQADWDGTITDSEDLLSITSGPNSPGSVASVEIVQIPLKETGTEANRKTAPANSRKASLGIQKENLRVSLDTLSSVLNVKPEDLDYVPPKNVTAAVKYEEWFGEKRLLNKEKKFYKRSEKGKWPDFVNDILRTNGIHCAFHATGTPTYPMENKKGGYTRGYAKMRGRCSKHCGIKFKITLRDKPRTNQPMVFDFELNGVFHLNQRKACSRRICGTQREELQKRLKNTTANMVYVEDLKHVQGLRALHRNLPARSEYVYRKIKSEGNLSKRLHKNPAKEIKLLQQKYGTETKNAGTVQGFVQDFQLSPEKFSVYLYTQSSLQLHKDAFLNGFVRAYYDATGNVVKKPDDVIIEDLSHSDTENVDNSSKNAEGSTTPTEADSSTKSKEVENSTKCKAETKKPLLYCIVGKNSMDITYPIASMLSARGRSEETAKFMSQLRNDFRRIGHSNNKPFAHLITIDMSFSLMHGLLEGLNVWKIEDYFKASWDLLNGINKWPADRALINICCAHFIHATSSLLSTVLSKRQEHREIHILALSSLARMQESFSLDEFKTISKAFVRVFGLEWRAPGEMQNDLQILQKRKTEVEINIKNEPNPEEIEILHEWGANTLRKNSPFYTMFEEIRTEQLFRGENHLGEIELNPYYNVEVLTLIQNYKIPYFPFWSACVPRVAFPGLAANFIRESNATIESQFHLQKNILGQGHNLRYPDYIRNAHLVHTSSVQKALDKCLSEGAKFTDAEGRSLRKGNAAGNKQSLKQTLPKSATAKASQPVPEQEQEESWDKPSQGSSQGFFSPTANSRVYSRTDRKVTGSARPTLGATDNLHVKHMYKPTDGKKLSSITPLPSAPRSEPLERRIASTLTRQEEAALAGKELESQDEIEILPGRSVDAELDYEQGKIGVSTHQRLSGSKVLGVQNDNKLNNDTKSQGYSNGATFPDNKYTKAEDTHSTLKHTGLSTSKVESSSTNSRNQVTSINVEQRIPVPRGLPNIAGSCYINSLMQAIFSLPVLHQVNLSTALDAYKQALYDIKYVKSEMQKNLTDAKTLLHCMCRPDVMNYNIYQENDPSELFIKILENEVEVEGLMPFFEIKFRQRTACQRGHAGTEHDNVTHVLLQAEPNIEPKAAIKQACQFTETVEKRCNYKTCRCNEGISTTTIAKAPEYLGVVTKIYVPSAENPTITEKVVVEEQFKTPCNNFSINVDGTQAHYQLRSYVTHTGVTADGGHYKAYCRRGRRWIECDDSGISPVTGIVVPKNETVLLSFYEKVQDF